jgi:hypothetical protein
MLLESTLIPLLDDQYAWIFAIGFIIGMSILMTYITEGKAVHFLGWGMLWSAFCVWGGLIDVTIFFIFFIGFITLVYFELRDKRGLSSG